MTTRQPLHDRDKYQNRQDGEIEPRHRSDGGKQQRRHAQ